MGIESGNLATLGLLCILLGILFWGYSRAKPLGKPGILSWLQGASLVIPWAVCLLCFAAGIYLNLAGILLLLIICTGLYVYLGNLARASRSANDRLKSQKAARAADENGAIVPEKPKNPERANPLPIPPEDLREIQGIFGLDTFFVTKTIAERDGVVFRGNLRGSADKVHTKLTAKLEEKMGDRYRLFLVPNQEDRPVVVVLPSSNDPQPATIAQKLLAVLLALATLATSLETMGLLLGFDFFQHTERLAEVLPFAVGIWTILGVHEIAHRVAAAYHKVRISPPFFIPAWQIATFGALDRFVSPIPNRKVLFDVAFAGPAAGTSLAAIALVAGLLLSKPDSLLQMPSSFFRASILVGTLAKATLGDSLQEAFVGIHPLVAIGWLGLAIGALNLLPAGQLDGGRIVQSIYGRKVAGRLTVATIVILFVASLLAPIALYWAVAIFFLQRTLERPTLNELIEPNDTRALLGLLGLFVAIATLLPFTPSLALRLGIGP